MKHLKILLFLLLAFGVSGLRGQSSREELSANPACADGIYRVYTPENTVRTPVPKGYKPFYISHFGRHGSRWLLRNSEYTDLKAYFDAAAAADGLTDFGRDVRRRIELIHADGIDRAGDLAPLGAVQHREIAGRMYADYPAVFAGDARIDARSTTVVRCVLSMAAFCERLKELNPDLQITRTAGIRNTRIFNFFNAQANPGVSPEYLALPKSRAWRQAGEEFRASRIDPSRLLGRLFTAEYAPRVKQPQQLLQMLNNTRASLHGLDLEVSLDDLFTADELYALWESDNRDFYLFRGPNPATGRYPEYLAKVLLEDLLDRADRAIASGTPAADLRFGHDANLMTLLNLMQFGGCSTAASTPDAIAEVWRNYRISPMAANLQLVFYRRKGSDEVLVKMLHNEREVRIPLASGTAPYYCWTELKKFYRDILDGVPAPPVALN